MITEVENQGTNIEYSVEEIKHLPATEQKEFCRSIVAEVLQNNQNGLSVTQIAKITSFNRNTVRKHLEYLVAIREAYKVDYGNRITVFFPNGKLAHPMSHNIYKIGDKYYNFKVIKNSYGEFLFIQEKKKDEYNRYRTLGGLVIQKDFLDQFIKKLVNIAGELEIPLDMSPLVEVSR